MSVIPEDCGAMRLVPEAEIAGEDAEDTRLLRELPDDARAYLLGTGYWRRVARLRFGLGVGGIFGVFLAEAEPARDDVDREVWVIVGDLPPLYLVTDEIATPAEALAAYIEHRRAWVSAVRANASVAHLAPVDVEPTKEWAAALAARLDLLAAILAERR
jgi:hypothetical protein